MVLSRNSFIHSPSEFVCVYVCVCVFLCVYFLVCLCVFACVRARVCVHACFLLIHAGLEIIGVGLKSRIVLLIKLQQSSHYCLAADIFFRFNHY